MREEEVFRGFVIKSAVEGGGGGRVGLVGGELEEEDEAVDGVQGEEGRGVER